VSGARAAWLPQVNAYGYETWLQNQPAAKFGAVQAFTSQDQFLTYGVTATQLLYDFGRTSAAINAARYGAMAREIETRRARNRSALEFIFAYYNLLESEKLLAVADEEVKRYEAHLKDAQDRYGAGVVTKNEVLQAEVTLADAKQRYLSEEHERSIRASRINSLLLKPLDEPVTTVETSTMTSAGISLQDASAAAESESPEIQIVDEEIKAKEEAVKAVEAEYLPTFYLSGGYQYQENEYQVHEDNWSLIAGVKINLWSGGATRSRAAAERSELLSLKLTRDKIADAVRLVVKTAYLDLETSARKIDVAGAAIAQAEENLRLQRLRYQEGVGTATDVLDAVALLSTAESNNWRALYAVERARAGLFYSVGRDLVSMYAK
jgi:outer membrane protein